MQGQIFQTIYKELPPSVNAYLKPSVRIDATGKPKAFLYESSESKRFKKGFIKHLKDVAKLSNWNVEDTKEGHWILECTFIQSRTNQDNNNYYKILCDSLVEANIIDDDKNVLVQTKRVLYNSKCPTFMIKLYKAEYVGIFDDESHLMDFELSNCSNCKKNKNKCTLYKNAVKGKVQDEIILKDLLCKKKK